MPDAGACRKRQISAQPIPDDLRMSVMFSMACFI